MATNPGHYWDYVSGSTGKKQPLVNDPLPIVAITTTAGTGTEADPFAVITKLDTIEKIGFANDALFPVVSIVDPALMTTVPPNLTAYQGFDALFHSTEGYLNVRANPISDIFALEAIRLVGKSLETAVKDGSNMNAREDIALANTLSGFNEGISGCISMHGIEHSLSGHQPKIPHGAGLIFVSIAYYKNLISRGARPERFIKMAQLLGIPEANKPEDFITALENLQKACGVDNLKMSEYGIDPSQFGALAKTARDTMSHLFKVDPVEVTDEDVVKILADSYR
jgi:alcohol dehydrogenase